MARGARPWAPMTRFSFPPCNPLVQRSASRAPLAPPPLCHRRQPANRIVARIAGCSLLVFILLWPQSL